MKIIHTRLIILNGEKRVQLNFDESNSGLLLLLIKLPECSYSPVLKNWHIKAFDNYINILNHSSPDHLLFIDVTSDAIARYVEELIPDKRIIIYNDSRRNKLKFNFLNGHGLTRFLVKSNNKENMSDSGFCIINNPWYDLEEVLTNMIQMDYTIIFKDDLVDLNENKMLSRCSRKLIVRFRQLMESQSYSKRTIDAYIVNISGFLNHCGTNIYIESFIIKSYIDEMSMTGRYSRSSQNQIINSIKVYFRLMYNRELGRFELPRPRRKHKIPEVLTKNEIEYLIRSIPNLKQRTMITVICETGIKPSELIELKPEDIDYRSKNIVIRGGIGKNTRKIPLTSRAETALRSYISDYSPENYLFEGLNGRRYSIRSLQKIFQVALTKAQIDKNASIYALRHSYAIHKFESGTDPETVQLILGHSSRKTTENYYHLLRRSKNMVA